MFFILNNENAVLAADEAFLESVGTTHIFLLAERFRFGDFQLDEENRTCLISGKTRTFTKSPIQTILGGGSLYRIDEEELQVIPAVATAEADQDVTQPTLAESQIIPVPVPDPGVSLHETAEEVLETDTATLSTPDQPVTPVSPQRETPNIPEPKAALSPATPAVSETPEPRSSVSETDTLTLSTPDLPETFESEEDDLLAMLDEKETPAAQAETVDLPDWLETPDEPVTPETSETASSESQDHGEDDLLDLLDLEEEVPAVEHAAPQPEAKPELDLLEIRNEPATLEIPESAAQKPETHEEDDLLDLLDLEEEVPAVAATKPAPTPPAETEEDLFDLLDVNEDDKATAPVAKTPATPPPLDDLISLKEEAAAPEMDAPLSLKGELSTTQLAVPTEAYQIGDAPLADYQANAEMIGITPDEYLGFLRQFTDESLQYEAGLKSNDLYVFKKNLISIKDASQLLHLPQLSKTLDNLEGTPSEEREKLISNFYGMIQHIRRDLDQDATETIQTQPQPEPVVASAPEPQTPPIPVEPSLSFDAVEPIPFNFSAKAASDELGLPESLVQEFVSDFVQQAKENIPVFEEAQRSGNIDTIQKTAHLLKGAASNLRIDPLAETLKALQYNESTAAVPELFQTFVGQLKTLVQFTKN